jgi:hypothetical protein
MLRHTWPNANWWLVLAGWSIRKVSSKAVEKVIDGVVRPHDG